MRNTNYKLIAFLAFAMYFLTGAACMLVGSSLPQLVEMYGKPTETVVLLGSAYALGRVSTAYIMGRLVEKIGPIKVLLCGIIFVSVYFIGVPSIHIFFVGMISAFFGGAGMATQDTVCPVLLSTAFKNNYAGSLSAGQALFGLGNFATPFIIGVLLSSGTEFFYGYYLLLLIPIIMLICLPFVKLDMSDHAAAKEEGVKPLYAKNTKTVIIAAFVICVVYSATVNAIGLYTSSYALSIGVSEASSAFMLTAYNIGCTVGSFAFVIILRKVKARTVLIANNVMALVAIVAALALNNVTMYFILLFCAGFFLGVLFSVIVTIGTRIGYKRISVASSLIAIASGFSDILTPIVTGRAIAVFGIGFSYLYVIIMIVLCIVAAVILKMNTTEVRPAGLED